MHGQQIKRVTDCWWFHGTVPQSKNFSGVHREDLHLHNIMTDFQSKNFSGVHRPPFNVSWDSPNNVTGAAPGMTSEPPRNPMVDTAFSFDESENVQNICGKKEGKTDIRCGSAKWQNKVKWA